MKQREESTSADTARRWGQGAVDLQERSLPALKASRAMEALPNSGQPLCILDFGCGEGKLLRTLARERPGCELSGADIQKPLDSTGYVFYLLPVEGPSPLPGEKYDAVTSLDVLEHVTDLDRTLKSIRDSLKPGGRLIAFMPAEGQVFSFYSFFRLLLGRDVYARTKDHRIAYSRRQWVEAVSRHLEVESVTYSYHWFGGALDATFFALQIFKPLMNWWWNKNSYYRPEANEKDGLNVVMRAANWLCYWEARLLARVPIGANGVHLVAKKRAQFL